MNEMVKQGLLVMPPKAVHRLWRARVVPHLTAPTKLQVSVAPIPEGIYASAWVDNRGARRVAVLPGLPRALVLDCLAHELAHLDRGDTLHDGAWGAAFALWLRRIYAWDE